MPTTTKKARYKCLYCGTHDISDYLSLWQLKAKRCAVCDHGKFTAKPLTTGLNVYGYADDLDAEEKETTLIDWEY